MIGYLEHEGWKSLQENFIRSLLNDFGQRTSIIGDAECSLKARFDLGVGFRRHFFFINVNCSGC